MRKSTIFWGAALATLPLDLWTKYLVATRMRLHESIPLIDGILSLTYVRNKGAAFGILADSSLRIPFFITVTLLALGGIAWYLRKIGEDHTTLASGLSLIFFGAIGNLIDRVRFGEVVDFIDVYWKSYHWPAFNVADSAITIGVTLMLIDAIFFEPDRMRRTQKSRE